MSQSRPDLAALRLPLDLPLRCQRSDNLVCLIDAYGRSIVAYTPNSELCRFVAAAINAYVADGNPTDPREIVIERAEPCDTSGRPIPREVWARNTR